MKFNNEEERLKHPEVGRIPKAVFQKFFGGELPEREHALMRAQSLEELSQLSKNVKLQEEQVLADNLSSEDLDQLFKLLSFRINGNKTRSLISIMYGSLEMTTDELMKVALEDLGLPKEILFQVSALTGKMGITKKIAENCEASQLKKILKYPDGIGMEYSPFLFACLNGQQTMAEWLFSLATDETGKNPMLQSDRFKLYNAFCEACCNGQRAIAEWLLSLTSNEAEKKSLLEGVGDYGVFYATCGEGHQKIAEWLLSLASDENEKNMMVFSKEAFSAACGNGHQALAKWLLSLASDENEKKMMLRGECYEAFMEACSNGHQAIAEWLFNLVSDENEKKTMLEGIGSLFEPSIYTAFQDACEGGRQEIAIWLLSLPYSSAQFSYLEQHYRDDRFISVLPLYVNDYLESLSLQIKNEAGIFDFHDNQEQPRREQALKGYYVLRYLIRQSENNQIYQLENQIELLLQIPAIRELVVLNTKEKQLESREDFADQTNELLRLAISNSNKAI
ncbi:MAG: hypothetical protein JSS53_10515, partial [Proteobacteria bacterium]|nr:hypothetical protein [Pseudomonadota bacterium]